MLKDFKRIVGKKTDEDIAIEKYKRMLREGLQESPNIHLKLGQLYERTGDKNLAINEYLIAARLYTKAEETTGALVANKLIAQLDPEDRDALANLAYLQFQQGVELSQKGFEKFLQDVGEPQKKPLDVAAPKPPKSRIAHQRTKRSESNSKSSEGTFQAGRKFLVDLIEGKADADDSEDTTFYADRKSLVHLIEEELNADDDDDDDEPSNITDTITPDQEILVDLTKEPSETAAKDSHTGKDARIEGTERRVYKQRRFSPALARISLFSHLSMSEIQTIAEHFVPVNVKKEAVIITEGELDESIYLIESGKVKVYTTLVERGELQVVQTKQESLYLATLQEGDFFGEGAFFTKEPRSATISALTDVQLLKLPARDLTRIINDYPRIGTLLRECHQQRVANTMKLLQTAL